ncbi:MAG: hypothetical protein ACOCY6_05745, partial [Halodesulfurarchaeum sp.]
MSNPIVVLGVVVFLIMSSMGIGFATTDAALADDESAVIGFTADVQALETVVFEPIDPGDNRSETDRATNRTGGPGVIPDQNATFPGPALEFADMPPEAQNESTEHTETETNGTANTIGNTTGEPSGTDESPVNGTTPEAVSDPTPGIVNGSTNPAEPQNETKTAPAPEVPADNTSLEPEESSSQSIDDQSEGASEGEGSESDTPERSSAGEETEAETDEDYSEAETDEDYSEAEGVETEP